jgi:hypothetical protein
LIFLKLHCFAFADLDPELEVPASTVATRIILEFHSPDWTFTNLTVRSATTMYALTRYKLFKVSSKYKTLYVTVQSFRAGGSQPVVRVPLVVHEEVLGGMQQYFKIKTLQNNMPIGRPTLIRGFFNEKEILLIRLTKGWKPLV